MKRKKGSSEQLVVWLMWEMTRTLSGYSMETVEERTR